MLIYSINAIKSINTNILNLPKFLTSDEFKEYHDPTFDKNQMFELWKIHDILGFNIKQKKELFSEENLNKNLFLTIVKNNNLGKMAYTYSNNNDESSILFYVPTKFNSKVILFIEFYLTSFKMKKRLQTCKEFSSLEDAKLYYANIKKEYRILNVYALIFNFNNNTERCNIKYEKILL